MERTPLEAWIAAKLNGYRANSGALTRTRIAHYQLDKLQETIDLVKTKSLFYRRHLAGIKNIASLEELSELPFTTAQDIQAGPLQFLCVSQREINRVVTLQSSGTTGQPKRLYFTRDDHELTIDFFQHGMSTLVKPGERVFILLPGELPDSVGDLLVRGLKRLGATGIPHGPVRDAARTIEAIAREKADCLVGIPIQVLSLARYLNSEGRSVPLTLKSVLLSTDHVPGAVVKELAETWGCRVFNHYGMTEMGLGGGVDCQALAGYHLREGDLYFEIVNPVTGEPVPAGEFGEVVFTTLTRRGMPLIRYRTGDISRLIPEPCPCGTILKRMEWVKSRLGGIVQLTAGACLTMAELDEALFALPGVLDFSAALKREAGIDVLAILVKQNKLDPELNPLITQALRNIPAVDFARQEGSLVINAQITAENLFHTNGTAKRRIADERRLTERNPSAERGKANEA